jgi:hypothetical protein
MNTLYCTAASLRAILCYIDPNNTPKIAFDTDDVTVINTLIERLRDCLRDKDGSETVILKFDMDKEFDRELLRQFNGVCGLIRDIFDHLKFTSRQD